MPPVAKVTLSAAGFADFTVQYNPTELMFEKQLAFAEITIPGLDAPLQQFVRGQAEKLSIELFFDTTETGMGLGATSVTTFTDKVFQLARIDPDLHAPPIVTFLWNHHLAGDSLDVRLGGQNRDSFKGVIESIRQKFTLFSPEGIPLRATVNVVLREYRTLDEQLTQLNLKSPDRTRSHTVRGGETLSAIATQEWERPEEWRRIADENEIEDPRRLHPGVFLDIPVISPR
jgi:Contractile injection system tube protein